jgi:hypothetical protein
MSTHRRHTNDDTRLELDEIAMTFPHAGVCQRLDPAVSDRQTGIDPGHLDDELEDVCEREEGEVGVVVVEEFVEEVPDAADCEDKRNKKRVSRHVTEGMSRIEELTGRQDVLVSQQNTFRWTSWREGLSLSQAISHPNRFLPHYSPGRTRLTRTARVHATEHVVLVRLDRFLWVLPSQLFHLVQRDDLEPAVSIPRVPLQILQHRGIGHAVVDDQPDGRSVLDDLGQGGEEIGVGEQPADAGFGERV